MRSCTLAHQVRACFACLPVTAVLVFFDVHFSGLVVWGFHVSFGVCFRWLSSASDVCSVLHSMGFGTRVDVCVFVPMFVYELRLEGVC